MTRAAITHFDGDPLVIDFWLFLYRKFWRGEVNTVYADVCYGKDFVPDDILEAEKKSFAEFTEIKVDWIDHPQIPELSNPPLIKKSTEESLMLIESDGWIFGKGLVDKYFKVIEGDIEIVAGNYRLLDDLDELILGYVGFMRNLFFIKSSLFKSLDLDFMPRFRPGRPNMDCFAWICLQLAERRSKVQYIPTNFVTEEPDPLMNDNKWLHIRHFNSSLLGYGNYESIFKGFKNNDREKIDRVKKEVIGNSVGEFMYIKAIAFRFLMLDVLKPSGSYYDQYKEALLRVISELKFDINRINIVKEKYLKLMEL